MTDDKKIPGVSEQATNLVKNINKWNNPHIEIAKPEVPDAPIPQVNTLNESELERKLDEKLNLPRRHIDTTVGRPTDADVKAEGVRLVNEGKARVAEAKEKYQEEQEAKHRKAEKMWSAIGDGISAIANMATVGAGADSMYNPTDSLHSKVKSKWDEIKANKAAIAAAENKARMDLLLKELELGARAAEAEANRNFNVWKVGVEEGGKNQRAENQQKFDAEQNKLKNDTSLQVAKIRGRSGGGSGSSSTGKYFFNGQAFRSASERNKAILRDAQKYKVVTKNKNGVMRDWDDLAVELEDLIAQGEPVQQPEVGGYAERWGNMYGEKASTSKTSNKSNPSDPFANVDFSSLVTP